MKTIATVPLLALALTACDPYYGDGQSAALSARAARSARLSASPVIRSRATRPTPTRGIRRAIRRSNIRRRVTRHRAIRREARRCRRADRSIRDPGQPNYPPQGYPQPGYPSQQGNYRAIGTEPFWDLEIGRDLVFTDRGNNVSVTQPTPRPINGTAGEIYRTQRLEVNIVHSQCSDGMSDRTYPDTVQVHVDGRQYRGCGAQSSFFDQVR